MTATTLPTLPPNAWFFTRLRLAVKSLTILKDDPANTHYGPLLNACMDGGTFDRYARAWRRTSEGRALLDARPSLQGPDLDLSVLERMPEGSLGHAFARYFKVNGIGPFVSSFPIDGDVAYLSKRYRETHDLVHVITGYGTDEPGEMEVQAFIWGNLGLWQTLMILSFGIPREFGRIGVRGFGAYLGRLRAAYGRGRRSRELLSVPYERFWERPVAELSAFLCAPA